MRVKPIPSLRKIRQIYPSKINPSAMQNFFIVAFAERSRTSVAVLAVLLMLAVSCCMGVVNLHPDHLERDQYLCSICETWVVPAIVRAVKTSEHDHHTLQSVEQALSGVLLEAESHDNADDVREYLEHLLWDTHTMRQYSAVQRVYHRYPEYGNMIDQLIDVVVCACGKHNGNDRMLEKLLQKHAATVQREYQEHGGRDEIMGQHGYDVEKMKDFKPQMPQQGSPADSGGSPGGGMMGGGGGGGMPMMGGGGGGGGMPMMGGGGGMEL